MNRLGIRPTNDFAFLKSFGSPGNTRALLSLLNAILRLPVPIVEVTLQNPFNRQEFEDDKLSVLDIRAVDQHGAIYDIEMQMSNHRGLVHRLVFYGCEIYADQMRAGDDYQQLKPVYAICLLEGRLWEDSTQMHHAFRLIDSDTGRCLTGTLEVHTLEMGWYNLQEPELATASGLERWVYWLLHAHEYEAAALKQLFPDPAFVQATEALERIAEITEDKTMYDRREKAIRDQKWILSSTREEGREKGLAEGRAEGLAKGLAEGREKGLAEGLAEGRLEGRLEGREEGIARGLLEGRTQGRLEGEISLIQSLQRIAGVPVSTGFSLQGCSLEQLQAMSAQLQSQLQNRLRTTPDSLN